MRGANAHEPHAHSSYAPLRIQGPENPKHSSLNVTHSHKFKHLANVAQRQTSGLKPSGCFGSKAQKICLSLSCLDECGGPICVARVPISQNAMIGNEICGP